jgi:hypothetical protein
VQSQQLPAESQVFKDGALAGTASADHPAEEMSERRDQSKNLTGTVQIQRCATSLILQVYDVLARRRISSYSCSLGRLSAVSREVPWRNLARVQPS